MLELKGVGVKVNGFSVTETGQGTGGAIVKTTISVDVELDVLDAGRFGGLGRAVESIIADCNSRSDAGEKDKDTIKLKITRALPLMQYTLSRAGAENDEDESESGTLFDPANPRSSVARKLTITGDAKNAEARIVKGMLFASWKVDANLTTKQIATLATMVKTSDVTLTSTSVQAKLALAETKREEEREGTGKAAGESKGRGRVTRKPAIAEAADALGDVAPLQH